MEAIILFTFLVGLIFGIMFYILFEKLYEQSHPDPKEHGLAIDTVAEKHLIEGTGGIIYTKHGVRYFVNSGLMSHFNVGDMVVIAFVTRTPNSVNQLHPLSPLDPYQEIHTALAVESIGPDDLKNGVGKAANDVDVH
jgi:hypothetical protein